MFEATIGPQEGTETLTGVAAGAEQTGVHAGVIVVQEMHGRQANSERRPPKSSQEAPVHEAQGAQEAQEMSAAAAQGAQS